VTNVFPKESYFFTIERSEWTFLGSIFELQDPIPLFGTKLEGFHGQRDTSERDIIIGGFLSVSPIVIYVVRNYKSSSPADYFSHANTICIFA
jgi:hypothetical protein